MKSFKEYKKMVESIRVKNGDGVWKIELSDVAKYSGEYNIEYKYDVYKELKDGRKISSPVRPPFKVRTYNGSWKSLFDHRFQLSKKGLLFMIKEAMSI